MNIKNFLELTPKELPKQQYDLLKTYTITKLKNVLDNFENDDLDGIEKLLGSSDETDIKFIDMSYEPEEMMDIGDVVYQLKSYQSLINKD